MYLAESFVGHVGVNLRRRNGRVPKERLNASNVGAVSQEIGRETMSERMRMNRLHNAGFGRETRHNTLDCPHRDAQIVACCFLSETLGR